MIDIREFGKLDLRVGTVVKAEPFPEARVPAYKLEIDFGPLGKRRSSAQITTRYEPGELVGKQVVAVMNLPPKRIAGFTSEVLVLGVSDNEGAVILLQPDEAIADGAKVS
jgi:tRNA-binding protein